MKNAIAALIVILALTGCAQRKIAKVEEAKPPQEEAKTEAVVKTEEVAAALAEQTAKVQTEEVAREAVEKPEIKFDDIYFDYDRYEIRKDAMPALDGLAAWLLKNPQGVLIEGHCDDRGTNEYNLALGDRRATSVRNYLKAAGVPKNKISIASFGEEKPLCTEQTEECWAKNRRAHFVIVETAK